jgi:hypothetical protein
VEYLEDGSVWFQHGPDPEQVLQLRLHDLPQQLYSHLVAERLEDVHERSGR